MAPLELMILKSLDGGPNHGFGLTLHIQEVSGGLLRVEEGSLYPALHRLEKEGVLSSEWTVTPAGRKAKMYRLTAGGKKRLAKAEEEWANVARGVGRLMRFA